MGRPLRKDVRGTDVLNTPVNSATGITVSFYDHVASALRTDGVLLKQRGANTFLVCRRGDIADSSKYFTCKLVNTTPNARGEMYMVGSTTGMLDANLVPIAKITRRLAYSFPTVPVLSTDPNGGAFYRGEDSNAATDHNATKYTWYLENDSSADYLVLTAV